MTETRDFATTRARFEADRRADFADSPGHLALIRELCDLYEARGLLDDGRDRPLWALCPRRGPCWEGRGDARPRREERAGIAVPWLGRRYLERRICLVGINFHDWGGLDGHWLICPDHEQSLARGGRGHHGLPFGLGAAAYVRLVEEALDGTLRPGRPVPPPTEAADAWQSCAFLEAVKCAPDRPASEPFEEMWGECVGLLLREELRILAPRVVILLGRSRLRDRVRPLLRVRWGQCPGGLERDAFELDGATVELLSCNHPSYPAWRTSFSRLVTSLVETPLGELRTRAAGWR